MDVIKALEIFEIQNVNNICEKDIKQKFRALMRKNHPDIGGSDEKAKEINVAYQILGDTIKKLKAYEQLSQQAEFICIIPFDKIMEIYKGEELHLKNKDETVRLNKKNLRSNKIILSTLVTIIYKGNVYNFEQLNHLNFKDEYSITCSITDTEINQEQVIVKAYNKELNLKMTGTRLNVVLSFDNLVKLTIHLERTEKHG